MGAWGLKLFQSDYDYDIIQMLNELSDLPKLEQKAGKKPLPTGTGETRVKEHNIAHKDSNGKKIAASWPPVSSKKVKGEINYSVYAGLCTHPDLIRKHLDSGVLLKAMLGVYQTCFKASKAELENPDGLGYDYVMFGACAISLGAKLTPAQKDVLRNFYPRIGLQRDAVVQMKAALDPETGYKNGTPWNFGSPGQRDAPIADKGDLLFPGTGQANTRAPTPHAPLEWEMIKEMFLNQVAHVDVSAKDLATGFKNVGISPDGVEKRVKVFGEKACAGCGEDTGGDGAVLTACGKCGKCSYCSKECQKAHWVMVHKKECKV